MKALSAVSIVAIGLLMLAEGSCADEIDDAAADGRGFANEIFPDAAVDENGNITIDDAGPEGSLTQEDLFPGVDSKGAEDFSAIRDETDADEAGRRARDQGSDAIDVLDSTNAIETEEDFSTDPFLDATDQVFGSIDQVAEEFGACTPVREAIPVESTTIIPELHFCERAQKVAGSCTITHNLQIDPTTNTVLVDEWGPPDCMVAASHAVGPSFCSGDITLVEGAELDACRDINGITICPGDSLYEQLAPPPFDGKEQVVSRLAQTVEIGTLDCDGNLETLPCIVTSTGEEICPSDEGTFVDTCGGLSEDPVCRFVDEGCVEGAEVDGVCHLEEARYLCDVEIRFETYQQQTSLNCPDSDIRCNGTDCVEVDLEINNGITRGLAALTASQLLAFDSTCGDLDPDSCEAYPGQVRACQRGVGGIFDACELPTPVGPGPYLDLVFSIGALDSNLTILEPTSPLRGAWEKLRDPAASALETLETPFASVSNTVSASTEPNANDTIAEDDLQRVRQDLLNRTADDLLSEHGDAAVNAIFVQEGGGEPAANNTGRNGDVALRLPPNDRTALSLVADAYSASAADRIDPDPAPLVEADDVSTAAHDDARNCAFVGTQCTSDSFGACISRDHVHCCFNSPYARLAQHAAAAQFGRDFGTADVPNCRGLTSAEVQAFDYTTLNLDEWIAILGTANRYPDEDKLTPDGLTGSGNFLNGIADGGERPDVIRRTRERLNGVDAREARQRARDEIIELDQ